jgi:hypothetical protein
MDLKRLVTLFVFLLIMTAFLFPQFLVAETSKELSNARIDDIAANFTSITVRNCSSTCEGEIINISVKDTGSQKEVKNFKKGDHVSLQITNDNTQPVLQTIGIRTVPVSSGRRVLVLAISFAACLFLTALLTKFRPLRLVLGEDGRYSNSKLQMAMWFTVVIVSYIATIYVRSAEAGREFLGGVNIPQNLLLLSGMSALTFGGAKGITTSKVQSAIQAGVADPKPAAVAPSFWNLVQNDSGFFDIGDFQMLVITLLAGGMFLVLVFNFLGSIELRKVVLLPDVDTTILAAFGLGQGAYLAKKAAGTPGQS